ncbi:MAG: hypothetical protein KA436_02670 [Oligoflexales bacterium]|nr:hypothetical protein [Oligoflexales bacterium]
MKFEHSDRISAPRDTVYNLVRDHLSDLASYLPSVKEIKTLEKQSQGKDKTFILNQWFADVKLPSWIQALIPESLFSWKDRATWDDTKYEVTYVLESMVSQEVFKASGKNTFKFLSETEMELVVSCEVEIFADKIPGVPKLLARKVQTAIEPMIEKMLAPNMTSLGLGINKYLEKKKLS